ncbi:MAG TPA: bifunctional alpha/beta hydrolase/OsmC family protein [Alphaproteobacteria bacterium]|nr:bifunctional alpha/beta hydrolase/OsmC family protein [Alphaproteobacteria bacterium]
MSQSAPRVSFEGSQGVPLSARLEMPDGPPLAFAIFAHCFTCSKDSRAAAKISRSLAEQGIATLRFDFTGLGESEGEFGHSTFSSNVEDIVAAAKFLAKYHQAPKLLIGHSFGGTAVIAASARLESVSGVVTIGAPADPSHVSGHVTRKDRSEVDDIEVTIGGRQFHVAESFLSDIADHPLENTLAGLRKALLIFHAPLDEIVGIDEATKIFKAAKHPKSFVSLADANHLLTNEADATYVASVIAVWSSRYIDRPSRKSAASSGEQHERVVVEETGNGGYEQDVRIGAHLLKADEPEEFGGHDTGPSPYEYLLAGLGACTSMTLRMYAERKSWPLDRVRVRLNHQKIHAEDCKNCETKTGKIDRIERLIEIEGDLSEEQRSRLLEIADKCPVHRTLHSEILVETRQIED